MTKSTLIALYALLVCTFTACTVYNYNEMPKSNFQRVQRPKMRFFLLAPENADTQKSWYLENCAITGNLIEANMYPLNADQVKAIIGNKNNAGAINKNQVLLYPMPELVDTFKANQRASINLDQIATVKVSELDHESAYGKPLLIGVGMLTFLQIINGN